jgi:LPS-assembly protein
LVRSPFSLALAVALCALTSPAAAQPPLTLQGVEGEVSIVADRIEQRNDLVVATGNVEITRGQSRLQADRIELNRETGEAVAQGKVVFFDGQDRLQGERIDFNFKSGTGVVYNGSAFSAPYYRLSGERMERVGERVYNLWRGIFTTCEADPPPWSFRAARATADLDEYIVARDASFWVGSIPLIPWLPFLAAPIRRERQTGFLLPRVGTSSQKGFFAKIPFFWAISDSQDLTLSVDTFTKRGVGLGGEYRYILSESSRGTLAGTFIRETLRDDDDRGILGFTHDSQITPRLSLKADINAVSDDRYLREYGDRLRERSLQRVESNVFVTQRWDSWSLVGNALWYQDLTTRRPVELQRLPEIRLTGLRQPVPGAGFLLYEIESSFTNFIRDVGADGIRLDFHPRVFVPLSAGGLITVTPFGGIRETLYDREVIGKRVTTDGVEVEVTKTESRLRSQVELGGDAETRASRVYSLGGAAGIDRLQHLIEPRINYTAIQGVNQKATLHFDRELDEGKKVSAITYSVTNRLNAQTVAGPNQQAVRWEMVRLLLSQSVSLLPDAHQPFRDITGDLIVQPNQSLRARVDATQNVYGKGIQTVNSEFSYSHADFTAAVGTRFSEPEAIEFVRGDLTAKLFGFLEVRGGTNWDTRAGTVVENRFGADLRFQCWGISLEYIDRHKSEDEFRFSVNLLGLGSVGSRVGQ